MLQPGDPGRAGRFSRLEWDNSEVSNPKKTRATVARAHRSERMSIKDVARLADVSYQTVSRVINDDPRVSDRTRDHVWKIIQSTGFVPNPAARALVMQRSSLIGILTDGSTRYGPAGVLAAVENAARDEGYAANVLVLAEADSRGTVRAYQHFIDQGVAGIVVIAPKLPLAEAVRETKFSVPVVMVAAGESSVPGVAVVSEDQEYGARLATRRLLDKGHREVAHLAGELSWLDGRVRLRGWQSELRAAGIEPPPHIQGDWTGESGYAAGRRMLDEGLPSSIFVASDLMCLGMLRAFYEAGVRVPDDISAVSFDDSEFAAQFYPPLDSVRQDFNRLGQEAVHMLLRLIQGEPAGTVAIPPVLTVRSSVARPRAAVARSSTTG